MTIEICAATELAPDVTAADTFGDPEQAAVSTAEGVAVIVSGISIIGEAQRALQSAGWTATIAANRITVNDALVAQLIPARMGTYGMVSASWVVSSIAGASPVWITGTG